MAQFPEGLEWLGEIPPDQPKPDWYDWIQTCPPKHATRRRWERPTLGHQVRAVADLLGWDLMPWQSFAADVALEYDMVEPSVATAWEPAGGLVLQFFYRRIVGTVPRQSGKTTLMLPVKVHRCFVFPEIAGPPPYGGPQQVVYTAQDRNHAYKKWIKEHVPRIERAAGLAGLHKVRKTNGSEGISWPSTGSFYGIDATTETSGHGDTLDLHAGDEIFAFHDDRLDQSTRPAMITRPTAQQWLWSTMGDDSSTYLNEKVLLGRRAVEADTGTGTAYFEWAAPAGAELDDPDVWPQFHPACGITQTVESLMAEALSMDPDEARRAFFNWKKSGRSTIQKIPAGPWHAAGNPAEITGSKSLAIDMPPDRSAVYIAWASFATGGDVYAELDHVPIADPLDAPDRVLEILAAHDISIVAMNPVGPVGSLGKVLERLGIEVKYFTARDMANACGLVLDLVNAGKFHHGNQPEVDAAVGNTGERRVGEAFAWDALRTQPEKLADGSTGPPPPPISPLNAVTVAVGALVGAAEPEKPKRTAVAGVVDMPA